MRRVLILLSCIAILCGETADPEALITRARKLHHDGELNTSRQILIELIQDVKDVPPWLNRAYSDLGVVCHEQGRLQEAERWHLMAKQIVVPGTPMYVQVLNNLASVYLESGQYGQTERLVNELKGLTIQDDELVARTRGSIAALHMARGKNKEAEPLFLEVLAAWEKLGRQRDAAVILNNLGVIAMERTDWSNALPRLRRSYELWQKELGGDHIMFVPTMANYGAALLGAGQPNAAEEQLSRALALTERWHGPESQMTVQVAAIYAEALQANGRKKEAKNMRQRVQRASSALVPRTVDVLDLKAGSR